MSEQRIFGSLIPQTEEGWRRLIDRGANAYDIPRKVRKRFPPSEDGLQMLLTFVKRFRKRYYIDWIYGIDTEEDQKRLEEELAKLSFPKEGIIDA